MNIYDFNRLGEAEQTDVLLHHGVMIGFRKEYLYKVLLFQVNSFYVEVFYNPERNTVFQYKSFVSTDYLEPYLEDIELPKWMTVQ